MGLPQALVLEVPFAVTRGFPLLVAGSGCEGKTLVREDWGVPVGLYVCGRLALAGWLTVSHMLRAAFLSHGRCAPTSLSGPETPR